ncbi:MAG: hypothetical protein ABJB69_02720 [Spartobacteria bacterium]
MDEILIDDPLDRQLREAVPYIDDDGFTARVVASLPAPGRRKVSLRSVILVSIALLGSALAYVLSDSGRVVSENVARLATLPPLWLLIGAFAAGALAVTGGLLAALSRTRDPFSLS